MLTEVELHAKKNHKVLARRAGAGQRRRHHEQTWKEALRTRNLMTPAATSGVLGFAQRLMGRVAGARGR